jgi:hypothetical protein
MKLIFVLALCIPAFSQSICTAVFSQRSTVGVSATIDNRTRMCSQWVVTYNSTGFSAISIELDGALDVSGVPGAFGLAPGTVLTGTNPSTTTGEAQFIINGYAPWMRLNFSSKTGTGSITALAFGTSVNPIAVIDTSSTGSTPCAGTAGTPCVVDGPNATGTAPTKPPVLDGSVDGAGNVIPLQNCTITLAWTASATGNTQIIAASGSTVIRICAFEFTPDTSATPVNWKLQTGTGSNCVTGPADLTGVLSNVLAYSNNLGANSAWVVPSAKAVCFNMASGTAVHGTVVYAQY